MKQRQVDVLAGYLRQGKPYDAVSYLAGLSASDKQANELYMNVRDLKPAEQTDFLGKYLNAGGREKDVIGTYLNDGGIYSASGNLRQRGEKESYVIGSQSTGEKTYARDLVARVDSLSDYSLLGIAKAMKRFAHYPEKTDFVMFELDSPLVSRIREVVDSKGFPLDFRKVGNISLLLNYIHERKKIPMDYVIADELSSSLSGLRNGKRKVSLYQFCTEANEEMVERILGENEFKISHSKV
ncbi:MAG: hypothetical protein ABH840_00075 [Nanoarchaeota archaeon]